MARIEGVEPLSKGDGIAQEAKTGQRTWEKLHKKAPEKRFGTGHKTFVLHQDSQRT